MKTLKANLSVSSLNALIKALEDYKKEFYEREQAFLERLALVCQTSLQQSYDEAVAMANASREAAIRRCDRPQWEVRHITASYEADGDHAFVIKAVGQDVCFVEFGTGMFAGNPPNEYASEVPISIRPGSWSDTHEHTWEYWNKRGYPQNEYPYNIVPANAFPKAFNDMRNAVHSLAREVFGEGH